MKITAVIPVQGREPLLQHTVRRLTQQTLSVKVICCGHTEGERAVCEEAGATFIKVPVSTHLGDKWQICIDEARISHNPDAIMIMGSSDWVEPMWCEKLVPLLNEDVGMVGTVGLYLLDIKESNTKRMYWWPGYEMERTGDLIGTGRIVSKECLDIINWQCFDRFLNNSLDWSLTMRVQESGMKFMSGDAIGVAISTYKWTNKHNFSYLALNGYVDWLSEYQINEILGSTFNEALNLFGE